MRRYDKSKRRHREELEARLDALQRPGSKKRRRRRRGRSLGSGLFASLLLVIALAAAYLLYTGAGAEQQTSDGAAKVEVLKGETLTDVAAKLEEAGVIENAFVFKTQARIEGYGTEIKTGRYTFERGQESGEILEKLTTAGEAAPTIAVTIPEGLTLEETARTVAAGTAIPAAEFERAARETDYGYAFLEDPAIKTTEGYLFPRRYDFEKGVTAAQVVDRLLGQYLIETASMEIGGAKERHGLTEHELVTVASLIEKESANPEERPLIASVIYNRLRREMPLQIDATVQYALERPKEHLSLADLRTASPYNTYEHPGLPPGPICSPSRQSLAAAINPQRTDYLYYVLKANGREHFFTSDYDAFLREKARAGR